MSNYWKLRRARRRYSREMLKVIRGGTSSIFRLPQPPTGSNVISKVTSIIGNNLAVKYGAVNEPAISLRRKQAADKISQSHFMYPSTDILAYHRRIEQPEVFQHAPAYGF